MAEGVTEPRSYGCSYGCGNPYDFVVVTVSDMSSLALCAICFMRTATDMMQAVIDADNPEVQRRIAEAQITDSVPFDDEDLRTRGHNAPVDAASEDAIAAFDGYILPDELEV